MTYKNLSAISAMLLLMFVVSGCSIGNKNHRAAKPSISKDYNFSYFDKPSDKKFVVVFSSTSKDPVCMTNSTWPSEYGYLDGASNSVFVVVDGKKYPFKDYNMGVCPFKECAIKTQMGEKIEASLSYGDFDFPKELYSRQKELIFDPRPSWCDQGKWFK